MALCLRATFIDLEESCHEEEHHRRRRASSTPAGCRTPEDARSHFVSERSYVRTLASKVGLEVCCCTEDHDHDHHHGASTLGALPPMALRAHAEDAEAGRRIGRRPGASTEGALPDMPTAQARWHSESSHDSLQEEDEEFDEFDADNVTVTDTVQTIGSLPVLRNFCGTAATTVDSLCSLPEYSEAQGSELPGGGAKEVQVGRPRRDSRERALVGCEADICAVTEDASLADDMLASSKTGGASAEKAVTLKSSGRMQNLSGWAPEVEQDRVQAESCHPNMQYPARRPSIGLSYAAGFQEAKIESELAQAWRSGYEQDWVYESWDSEAEKSASTEALSEETGSQEYFETSPSSAAEVGQAEDVVNVAFKDKVALIFVSQDISTLEEVAAVRWAIQECEERGSAVSAVLLWMESGSGQAQHSLQGASTRQQMRKSVTEATEALYQVRVPLLGFASGSFGVWTSMLTAGCDQLLALSSTEFCVRSEGELRQVSAEKGMEMGFVGRLAADTDGLLQACSSFIDQVSVCSEEALQHMKSSLRGVRTYFMEAANVKATAVRRQTDCSSEETPVLAASGSSSLAAASSSGASSPGGKPVTSLMLRNLPCRLSKQQLVSIIDSLGFGDKVDCLHFPASKGSANPGYAFVNLATPQDASAFAIAFKGYRFANSRSTKVPDATPARIQGRAAMLEQLVR